MIGEISFYKTSLKIGIDCRDSGLGWILKKLRSLLGGNAGSSSNAEKENSPGVMGQYQSNTVSFGQPNSGSIGAPTNVGIK